jgi:hypothetical protein
MVRRKDWKQRKQSSIPSLYRDVFERAEREFANEQREYVLALVAENRARLQRERSGTPLPVASAENEILRRRIDQSPTSRDDNGKLRLQRCRKIVFPHVDPLPDSTAYIPIRRNFAASDIVTSNLFLPYLGDTKRNIESAYQIISAVDEIRRLQENQHDGNGDEIDTGSLAAWRRGFSHGIPVPQNLGPVLECGSLSIMEERDSVALWTWMQSQKMALYLLRKTASQFGEVQEALQYLSTYTSTSLTDLKSVLAEQEIQNREQVAPVHGRSPNQHCSNVCLAEDSTDSLLGICESDTMRSLFCRRCYMYDCAMHGSHHPLPRVRRPRLGLFEFPSAEVTFCSGRCFRRLWPNGIGSIEGELRSDATRRSETPGKADRIDFDLNQVVCAAYELPLLQTGQEIFDNDFCRIRQVCLPWRSCVECAMLAMKYYREGGMQKKPSGQVKSNDMVQTNHEDAASHQTMSAASELRPNAVRHVTSTAAPDHRNDASSSGLVSDVSHFALANGSVDRLHGQQRRSCDIRLCRASRPMNQLSAGRSFVYRPCDHEGACSKETCECVIKGRFCEKYCCCASVVMGESCPRAFKGCKCRTKCNNKKCPCFAADRECDPDSCTGCGARDPEDKHRTCENMNLQLGIQKRLLLGRSDVHGWGIFASAVIPKGAFIGEYCGEIVSQLEAEWRGRIHDHTTGVSYLFDLNDEQCIDAHRAGKRTKFINHSRIPPRKNCVVRYRIVNGDIRVALYADRQIEAGEELFFDYGYESGTNAPLWARAEGGSSSTLAKAS